ncbi:MAG TPA: tetratricopeptide repeat protein [Clostridiaceae bacterium]
MKYLNKAANLGSNEAMYELGMISLNEFGIEGFVKNQNVIKAYDYIFRAARQNYSPAMEFIASEYIKGNNIGSLDDKDVIDFLLKAIEQDNGMALNLMGVLCFEGKYMEKDLEKAEYYFDEAIDQDNSTAYYNRGKLYEQEGDRESALDCYTLGADMDEYYCLVELLKDLEYLTSMYSQNTIDWLKQSVKEIEALSEKTFAVKCDASRIIKV